MKQAASTSGQAPQAETGTPEMVFLSDAEIQAIPKFKYLTNYLAETAKPGCYPSRTALHSSKLKGLLPDTYILDIVRENGEVTDLIIRLLGTNIVRYYGELTGKSVQELPNKEALARTEKCIHTLLVEGRTVAMKAPAISRDSKHLHISVVYCPLAGEDQVINQVIGLVSVESAFSDK